MEVGQRPEQYGLDGAENGAVGGNAEREGSDSHREEPRIFEDLAEGTP